MIFKKGTDVQSFFPVSQVVGEDLARDMYAESLFSLFNVLWQNSPLEKIYRPYIEKYVVLPVSKFGKHNLSVIEFIENTSCQVYDWYPFLSSSFQHLVSVLFELLFFIPMYLSFLILLGIG
jgi:phosphatidylinositol kinase/protein kinase (PI-3  family)